MLQEEREACQVRLVSCHPHVAAEQNHAALFDNISRYADGACVLFAFNSKGPLVIWHAPMGFKHGLLCCPAQWQVEQALEQLRRAAAARDVRALRRAIADCADVGSQVFEAEGSRG